MNNTIKQLFERKSVRVYQDKPIEAKEKQLIFNAAIQAPTAGNMTLYSIIDIQDQAIKEKLAKTCDNQPSLICRLRNRERRHIVMCWGCIRSWKN